MSKFKINVNTGDIPIEVNDNGDMIYLRTDATFMKAVASVSSQMKADRDKYAKVLSDPSSTELQLETAIDVFFTDTEKAIDRVFGEGTCDKVFGDSPRTILGYNSFMEQITDILEQAQAQKASSYMKKK